MSEIRIIKKYPNRRLYDTTISSYITLEDARRLVQSGASIQVVEASTKNDITHGTLFQIIAEQEQKANPLFSNAHLQHLIRAYDLDKVEEVQQILHEAMDRIGHVIQKAAPNSSEGHKPAQAAWKPVQQEAWFRSESPETTEA